MGLDSLRFQQGIQQQRPQKPGGAGNSQALFGGGNKSSAPQSTQAPKAPSFAGGPQAPKAPSSPQAVTAPKFSSNFDTGLAKNLSPGINPSGMTPNMQGGGSMPIQGGQFGMAGKKLNLYA